MNYRRCGHCGVMLPELSLGLWHNFGADDNQDEARAMLVTAFDEGICHIDLANNYGPPPGSAEETFGRVLHSDLAGHRDELFISSKAGHDMWPGVYGTGSSRKNIIASCDQSLKRCRLEYFDIFYSHRYDGVTPVEETMQALVDLVRQGKALYVGISKYPPREQQVAYDYLRSQGVPCLLSQYRHSLFDRKAQLGRAANGAVQPSNFQLAADNGSGIICFSPLAQGLLTGKYSGGIPADSRAAKQSGFLQTTQVTPERVEAAGQLAAIAEERGETTAQMALAWCLSDPRVTSVIIGCSSVRQLRQNLTALDRPAFTAEQQERIERILSAPTISF